MCSMLVAPMVLADTSLVTGTFNPTTAMSGSLTNSTFPWGNLAISGNETAYTQFLNDGDVIIDLSINTSGDTTDLAYQPTLFPSTVEDEFSMYFESNMTDGGITPAALLNTTTTLWTDMPVGANCVCINVTLLANTASWSVDHGEQSLGVTVTYVENT